MQAPITIIYNPNSTGHGKAAAQELARVLEGEFDVQLRGTQYRGHAEKIAHEITACPERHIIVCSSGDGTYNEVVNGVLSLPHDHIVTAILPSGNANDHYHALTNGKSIVERLRLMDYQTIDVLRLQTQDLTRYAHSYIGFGLTPHIGEKLTEAKLNKWNEGWIVFKNLFTIKPVKIVRNGKKESYDNLVFSNVPKMSKVLKISPSSSLVDGEFEVVRHKNLTLGMLIGYLFRASTLGLHVRERSSHWEFSLEKAAQVQLDGEVINLDKNDEVVIDVAPKTLHCLA